MTLISNNQNKICFSACSKSVVESGQCDCNNRSVNLGSDFIANVSKPLFNNKEEAIITIEAYVGAAFIQDRVMTSDEYGKVKEATIWLSLNAC